MNFSSSLYVCRYCLVRKDKSGLSSTAELRTVENYNTALSLLVNDSPFQGVAKPSVFNKLMFYHVCLPGLPPCLGHDLFEGIVQFDLALILKNLCKKSTMEMSFEHINKVIKLFKFKGSDANDKPGVVSDGNTVGGHAVQNWVLLRLLPLLVFDVVDVDDDSWDLLLLLREVLELICAPKISRNQILYLNRLVGMYVAERCRLFTDVPLRPKHHYLLHYPWLTMQFGPLIRVWTMRMESKHTFLSVVLVRQRTLSTSRKL